MFHTPVIQLLHDLYLEDETETADCVIFDWLSLSLWYAGVRSQLKQKNIDNISKAEEQAAQQNYEASMFIVFTH